MVLCVCKVLRFHVREGFVGEAVGYDSTITRVVGIVLAVKTLCTPVGTVLIFPTLVWFDGLDGGCNDRAMRWEW